MGDGAPLAQVVRQDFCHSRSSVACTSLCPDLWSEDRVSRVHGGWWAVRSRSLGRADPDTLDQGPTPQPDWAGYTPQPDRQRASHGGRTHIPVQVGVIRTHRGRGERSEHLISYRVASQGSGRCRWFGSGTPGHGS